MYEIYQVSRNKLQNTLTDALLMTYTFVHYYLNKIFLLTCCQKLKTKQKKTTCKIKKNYRNNVKKNIFIKLKYYKCNQNCLFLMCWGNKWKVKMVHINYFKFSDMSKSSGKWKQTKTLATVAL